ncbi:MAG: hypothetical protein A2286_04675 [Gammaproteobacteria bacterium RIFOXYA12_FULL_61_12]|nr:MAG: hypothetical protein A2286_04675 [Gammaproteobacteria bacterium RIFOXYA12_FULL_61_12]
MAGAGSVLSKEALVGASNPASLSLAGDRVDFGLQLFNPDRSATVNGVDYSLNKEELFVIPEFGYSKRLNEFVTAGLLVYGNGGMNTESTANIPNYSPAGRKTGVDLSQLFIAPTISWDINDANSIGVALNLAYQRISVYGLDGFAGFTPSNSTAFLTDQGYSDSFGIGGTIGWKGKVNDKLTLGASYRSRTYMSEFEEYKELFAEQGDFDIPASIDLGLAFRATPALSIAFDIQHIFYGDVKSIANPNNMNGANTQLGNDDGKGYGWDDMTVFKLGFEYQAKDNLVLRAGVSHGDQPIGADDTNFNVTAPAVVEDHLTLGFTYTLKDGDEVTGYYMHAFDNSISGSGTGGGNMASRLQLEEDAIGVTYSWKI